MIHMPHFLQFFPDAVQFPESFPDSLISRAESTPCAFVFYLRAVTGFTKVAWSDILAQTPQVCIHYPRIFKEPIFRAISFQSGIFY